MAEEEVRIACETAAELGLKVVAHARSAESVKRAVRCGVNIIHHADFCDDEALDMIEDAKDRLFITPPRSGCIMASCTSAAFPKPCSRE
ncbi:hypothetical protein ACFSTD_21040 [Novosphingobium colocasiae]